MQGQILIQRPEGGTRLLQMIHDAAGVLPFLLPITHGRQDLGRDRPGNGEMRHGHPWNSLALRMKARQRRSVEKQGQTASDGTVSSFGSVADKLFPDMRRQGTTEAKSRPGAVIAASELIRRLAAVREKRSRTRSNRRRLRMGVWRAGPVSEAVAATDAVSGSAFRGLSGVGAIAVKVGVPLPATSVLKYLHSNSTTA